MYAVTTEHVSRHLHEATILAVWLLWLLAGQGGGSHGNEWWAACSLLAACVLAPARLFRLLRRLRWLLLAILLTFSLGTPGRLVVPDFPPGPTFEGFHAAMFAMINLAAMAACVAVLLQRLTPARLTGAIHRLIHPLSADHPAPDSFALRLQLVLRDIEMRLPARHWMSWLEDTSCSAPLTVEPCRPLSLIDLCVLLAASALLVIRFFA
jgi:energy-coupling factor transporter transmembrane protein EcfT